MRTIGKVLLVSVILYFYCNEYAPKLPNDKELIDMVEMDSTHIQVVNVQIDSTVFLPKDTTPYKGNWVDINE